MESEDFKFIRKDVSRLAEEYADADLDRVMNLMRRVQDDGQDAILPLMLEMKKRPKDTDFIYFAKNLIKEIMLDESLGAPSAKQSLNDFEAIKRALARIAERYAAGDCETARDIEETLAELGSISLPLLESARKAQMSRESAAILDRVIEKAKQAAYEQLSYNAKLGIPRRPPVKRAISAIKEIGRKIIGKN